MLRTSLSVLALTVAAPAFAGGIVHTPPPVQPPVVPVAADDWTEFYIGGQIDLIAAGSIFLGDVEIAELDGHLIGVFAGYRHDFGDFTLGAEIDYMIGTPEATILLTGGLPSQDLDVELLRVGLEGGYDLGDVLVYGTGGFAQITVDDEDTDGFFAGAGVDYRVSESIVVGAELLYHEFEEEGGLGVSTLEITTFGVNVAFTF